MNIPTRTVSSSSSLQSRAASRQSRSRSGSPTGACACVILVLGRIFSSRGRILTEQHQQQQELLLISEWEVGSKVSSSFSVMLLWYPLRYKPTDLSYLGQNHQQPSCFSLLLHAAVATEYQKFRRCTVHCTREAEFHSTRYHTILIER